MGYAGLNTVDLGILFVCMNEILDILFFFLGVCGIFELG